MSVSSTADRLKNLETVNLAFKGVHAELNLDVLGLEVRDYFYRVGNLEDLLILENTLCYHHPYIVYRGRCYGRFSGIYIQYRIPKGSYSKIEELNSHLKALGIIIDVESISRDPKEKSISIKSSLHCWDREKQVWEFDWKKWEQAFIESPTHSILKDKFEPINLKGLDEVDINLLAQLTVNARVKNVEMIKNIDMDPNKPGIAQLISRKLAYLKKNVISEYRIFLNWKAFDLYQTILIKGKTFPEEARKLRNFLLIGEENKKTQKSEIYFPFESIFFLTSEGFMWYVRAPPSHISSLGNFIWKICPDHEVFWIDYVFSEYYGLWNETFDIYTHNWKVSNDFMIKPILETIKEQKFKQ